MSIRAATWAAVIGAILLGCPWTAERAGATGPQTRVPGDFPVASDVRVGGDEQQTRFVVDFSHKVEIRAFTLANPHRVVIDMPQVAFQLPPRTGDSGRGLIKAFRFGLVMQGGSRMVIDLAKPARIEKAFVLDADNGQPARLVLDLAAVDRDTFMRAIALDNRPPDSDYPPRRHPSQNRPIRARWWLSIPATAASTTARRRRGTAYKRRRSCWSLHIYCASRSRRPANIAC